MVFRNPAPLSGVINAMENGYPEAGQGLVTVSKCPVILPPLERFTRAQHTGQ